MALQAKPGLLQTAFDRKIVLATPSTLMATLRSVSWALAAGRDGRPGLRRSSRGSAGPRPAVDHERSPHPARQGLTDAVTGYNQFVGSLDTRVMPSGSAPGTDGGAGEQPSRTLG